MKKKQFRFRFNERWHYDIKLEADNKEDAIKRFHKVYKGEYDYNKIEEL